MICPAKNLESAEILWDYCAHKLDAARAAEFDQHMTHCEDCRRAVAEQRNVWGALDNWTPNEVPSNFDARLYASIAQVKAEPAWKQWMLRWLQPANPYPRWKPAISLAAACAVLAFGVLVLRGPEWNPPAAPQMQSEKIDISQVEQTLEDLDLLTPHSQGPASAM